MATYSTTSPWFNTPQNNLYLELLEIRSVPADADDFEYTIEPQYRHRPDLLSYDLYGTPKLWWIFAQRNMDKVKDPIYDFEPGIKIKIPKKSNIDRYLGI
jgi:alpha-L-fucosidase